MRKFKCWWRGYHLGPFDSAAVGREIYVRELRCQDCGEVPPQGRFSGSTLIQWKYPNPLPPLKNITSGEKEVEPGQVSGGL